MSLMVQGHAPPPCPQPIAAIPVATTTPGRKFTPLPARSANTRPMVGGAPRMRRCAACRSGRPDAGQLVADSAGSPRGLSQAAAGAAEARSPGRLNIRCRECPIWMPPMSPRPPWPPGRKARGQPPSSFTRPGQVPPRRNAADPRSLFTGEHLWMKLAPHFRSRSAFRRVCRG